MRTVLCLCLLATISLHAGEVIASGTLSVVATEDTTRTITYSNVRSALVTGSTGTTYIYRIKALGASTKTLKDAGSDDVSLNTTELVDGSNVPVGTDRTDVLNYLATDNQFTLFPTTAVRSIPAVVVCTVDVYDGATLLASDLDLKIDIQGVADTRSSYYTYPGVPIAPISIVQGGTVTLTYNQMAGAFGFSDLERDGCFNLYGPQSPAWTIAFSNGSSQSMSATATTTSGTPHMRYGESVTISVPIDQAVGDVTIVGGSFFYDSNGNDIRDGILDPNEVDGNGRYIVLSVTSAPAGGGGGTSGGGGGGSSGCGAGTVGGFIILTVCSLISLRRRRRA